MFQSALVRPHGNGGNLVDAGTIAETLVFYGSVNVFANKSLLHEVINIIGVDRFKFLIENKFVNITYSRHIDAVICNSINFVPAYHFTSIEISATPQGKKIKSRDDIREVIYDIAGNNKHSKKLLEFFISEFCFKGPMIGNQETALSVAHQELDDSDYIKSAIRILMKHLMPNYSLPSRFEFRPVYSGNDVFIVTNLDFVEMGKIFRASNPDIGDGFITVERLLGMLLEARIDVDLSASYMSELITKSSNSDIIRLRYSNFLGRREKSLSALDSFQEFTLGNGRAIREAVNSGERDFSDFIPVLEKSFRFKTWLAGKNLDANLLTEYYNEVTADSWISKLPAKALRYFLAAGVGTIEPVSGLVLAAADEFLVDHMFKGWRPSHFVEGPLKRFVSPD